jgi:hypothetical protein
MKHVFQLISKQQNLAGPRRSMHMCSRREPNSCKCGYPEFHLKCESSQIRVSSANRPKSNKLNKANPSANRPKSEDLDTVLPCHRDGRVRLSGKWCVGDTVERPRTTRERGGESQTSVSRRWKRKRRGGVTLARRRWYSRSTLGAGRESGGSGRSHQTRSWKRERRRR